MGIKLKERNGKIKLEMRVGHGNDNGGNTAGTKQVKPPNEITAMKK